MRKALAGIAALATVGLLLAAGRPGVVRLHDGVTYDGTVEEKTDTVAVTVRGITTEVPRDQIATITYGTFEQRWNDDYAKLAEGDAKARIEAARRAFDERRYDLTERALRDALSIDPNSAEAAELLRATQSQRRLERPGQPRNNGNNDGAPANTGGDTGRPPVTRPGQYETLTPEQIHKIKMVEFSRDDRRLRIRFNNRVVQRYLEANPNEEARPFSAFNRLPQAEQAARIIAFDKSMASDIEFVNDPEFFGDFRRDVLPVVLQGCATAACHGGDNAASKKFALITPAADTATIYTNFYVLQDWSKKVEREGGSIFDPAALLMINRQQVDQSLLLQYGLPPATAEHKHPTVPGMTPLYIQGRNDAKYAAVRKFITSLRQTSADYDIDFELKRKSASGEAPATQEAK